MKTHLKTNHLTSLIAVAALTIGVALPFSAAHANGLGCYKPMNMEDWMYGLGDLEQNIFNQFGKAVSFAGADTQLNNNGVATRLVYYAKRNGSLTTGHARKNFGHGVQESYDANGKVTNLVEHYTMQGFTGSAILTKNAEDERYLGDMHFGGPNGARLVGEISPLKFGRDNFVRTDSFEGDHIISLPMEIDCTTDESNVLPDYWYCTFTAVIIGFPVTLVKVNPDDDPYCSTFQDGGAARE